MSADSPRHEMHLTISANDHVIPPANFAMVCPGVYRSGYPKPMNHSFLKSLKLKTLIFMCPEDCDEANRDFCKQSGIVILQFGIQGNKEPFSDIPESVCSPITFCILSAGYFRIN